MSINYLDLSESQFNQFKKKHDSLQKGGNIDNIGTETTSTEAENQFQTGGFFFGGSNSNKALKAAKNKEWHVVKFMLNEDMISDLSTKDADGNTLMHYLVPCYSDNNELAKKIYSELLILPNISTMLNIKNNSGETPLHSAVSAEEYSLCQKLIDYGADPSIPDGNGMHISEVTSESDPTVNSTDERVPINIKRLSNDKSPSIDDFARPVNNDFAKPSDEGDTIKFINELKTNYNVKELQEKNKEIIKQDQEDNSDALLNAIPGTTLNPAGVREQTGAEEEEDEESEEEQDQFHVDVVKDFFINGVETVKTTVPDKKIILNYFNDTFKLEPPPALKTNKEMNEYFIKMSKKIIDNTTQDDKKKKEKEIEETIKKAFNTLKNKEVKKEFNSLFIGQKMYPKKTGSSGKVTRINVTGSGMKQRRKMIGRGLISEEVIKADKYLKLGKYKANKEKLLGGKLQIRSENENQVNNVKSQMISKNIRDILLKINKKEIINYSDVDKLDENEKNDLYNIGKKLHITELFEIPSTLKNQEEKLKDEFFKLRGSIMAGNNSPEILKKFKMILIKMKNNKMISLSEFNEILNIFLEMDY